MESWLYKQGEMRGEEKGVEKTMVRILRAVFVECVGRKPTEEEEQSLVRRARDVTPEQLGRLAKMPRDAFVGWLAAC